MISLDSGALCSINFALTNITGHGDARIKPVKKSNTYAVDRNTEMMKPNKVPSTSVGSLPPKNQNGLDTPISLSFATVERFLDRADSRASLMVRHISVFDARTSSFVNLSVP